MKIAKMFTTGLALTLALTIAPLAFAQQKVAAGCPVDAKFYTLDQIQVVGADPQSQSIKDLMATFNDLVLASNKHSIEDILKHYSPQFISGDNLKLDQIKSLILETWKTYPDICYASKPVEIRVNGDWATIETVDQSTGTAEPDKDIVNIPGKLKSDSRSLLFLRKMGTHWEITSDYTLREQAIIRYGMSEDIEIGLSAPEQVKAGESYSATIQTKLPEGGLSIVTIDNKPLTYPAEKVDSTFRTLGGESNDLQRVLKANTANHNEIVTATLALTSVEQKNPERPSLAMNGIATIVKRVNVVPISAEDVLQNLKRKEQVKSSASGQIVLPNNVTQPKEDDTLDLELAPAPQSPSDEPQE